MTGVNGSEATIGTVQLRVEKIAAQYGISHDALLLSTSEDDLTGMVLVRLVRKVATLPGERTLDVPASWWDALKEAEVRRSPIMRWWVKSHPVEYRTYDAAEFLPGVDVGRYRADPRVVVWKPL